MFKTRVLTYSHIQYTLLNQQAQFGCFEETNQGRDTRITKLSLVKLRLKLNSACSHWLYFIT